MLFTNLSLMKNFLHKYTLIVITLLLLSSVGYTQEDSLPNNETKEKADSLLYLDSLNLVKQNAETDSLKSLLGAPVVPFSFKEDTDYDTLFFIYANAGLTTPLQRSKSISEKIKTISEKEMYEDDSVVIRKNNDVIELIYDDELIITITEEDARWANMSLEELSEQYKNTIEKSVDARIEDEKFEAQLIAIGFTLLILIIVIVFIKLVNKFFDYLSKKIIDKLTIKKLELKEFNVFTNFIHFVFLIIKTVVIAIILYLTLPTVLSFFPDGLKLAKILFGYIITPIEHIANAVWGFLPDLFTIIIIWLVIVYLIKFLNVFFTAIQSGRLKLKGFYPDWARTTFNIVRLLLFAFMFIMIFPYLPGSDSIIFKGVTVFLGFLITIGASSSISNAISGIVITYMRPFLKGDWVKIGENMGEVIEKSMLVTRIRTYQNEIITIPNSKISSGHIINYERTFERNILLILHTTVTIGYEVPWRKVHELLIDAAKATDGILKKEKHFVLQTSLDNYYVSYQLNAFTDRPKEMPAIYSRLHQNIQDNFSKAGIEIMSPTYMAHRDGDKSTIPNQNLNKNEQKI